MVKAGNKIRQPLISIITVVLNAADTLEKTLLSVLNQKFQDFEYIVVDGGSVDGTIDIIRKYESKLAHWESKKDKGVYDAMNKALSLIRGKWVYFLGADDQLFNILGSVADYLKDEKTIYYGNVYRPNMGGLYDGRFSAYKLACRNICQQSIFYPKCVWEKYAYNPRYPIFADYDLNLRCFTDPDLEFRYMPLTIAVFSDEGGISSTKIDSAFQRDKLHLIRDIFPYWIYVLMALRSFFMMFLESFGLQEASKNVYHSIRKMRSVPSVEKESHKQNS
ncbi:glycosyltransferase family 2 protein [uncultured Desulfosarcina sp.]|uniref:glycosyltransferase family 2 protein n=1 Tax=uncultured Desulfosarcina sp. TaxID=218289 RepID=UPI0029C875F6|nr:glycosyltransferase family 2 protein [uncultured Desulfosarcina sp.]